MYSAGRDQHHITAAKCLPAIITGEDRAACIDGTNRDARVRMGSVAGTAVAGAAAFSKRQCWGTPETVGRHAASVLSVQVCDAGRRGSKWRYTASSLLLLPEMPMFNRSAVLPGVLLVCVSLALICSGLAPFDRLTWLMEVAPVLIVLPLLMATRQRYPLTELLYGLIAVHAMVLIVGGAYTYARVPLGFWLQDWLGLARNPYDRIGHFMQGLVPALAAREILLRGAYVKGRRMVAFLCIAIAMMVSACYELVEWGAALALGQGADEFLGTQGDPWDTQWDMFMALIGASVAMLLLARWHDEQMHKLHGVLVRSLSSGT